MKTHRRKGPPRKHIHWQVVVVYQDGGRFARTYIDRKRAEAFAARERRSAVVKEVLVREKKELGVQVP